ncbi:MAG: 4a-hydroxytetrahydrobiopterin dehydratase [Chlamydiales bacterium]|jgi:4a-hydroxytetrahydrobiopterin dehydratase
MTKLSEKKCVACAVGVPCLQGEELQNLVDELNSGWSVVDGHHIEREFDFENFVQALDFTNRMGAVAEKEGHHPDIFLTWGKVKVKIFTHKINGLSESDFILAAKIDAL